MPPDGGAGGRVANPELQGTVISRWVVLGGVSRSRQAKPQTLIVVCSVEGVVEEG